MLEAAHEVRAARRVEGVVAAVPADHEALRQREARAVGDEQVLRDVRRNAPAVLGLVRERREVRVRGVELEELHVVVLHALAEREEQRAHRAVLQAGNDGDLRDVEVALEIVHEHRIDLRAHERAEADLREREAGGDTRRDALLEARVAERREILPDLRVEDERRGQVRQTTAQRERDGVAEEVPVGVLEAVVDALTRRETALLLDDLRQALVHGDEHRLVLLRNVGLREVHRDAVEDVQGGDALLRLPDVARAVRLADGERRATLHDSAVRDAVADDEDVLDDDLHALEDLEPRARPRVVHGGLQRVAHVDVGVALLLVEVDDAAACVVEAQRVHRIAEARLRRVRQLLLAERARAGEGHVVERGAGPELHGDAKLEARLALHAAQRIGNAPERRIERRDRKGQVRRVVGADIGGRDARRLGDALPGGGPRAAAAPHHLRGPDLRVEVPLVAIQLLHVRERALVGVGDERGVRLEVHRDGAGARREVAGGGPQRPVEATRVGVLHEVGAGELVL